MTVSNDSAEDREAEIRKLVTGANAHGGPLLFLLSQLDAERAKVAAIQKATAEYVETCESIDRARQEAIETLKELVDLKKNVIDYLDTCEHLGRAVLDRLERR